MPSIQESLDSIMDIDGAVGAALVDYQSGMTLGTIGGGNVDMELAGASNTEVVRSKKQVIKQLDLDDEIDDILITLGKQYHLIKFLPQNEKLFTYVILDKEKANLALARMKVDEIDGALELE